MMRRFAEDTSVPVARTRGEIEELALKPGMVVRCACGCGGQISFEDRRGQSIRHRRRSEYFLHGHNFRGRRRTSLMRPVYCRCGCGTKIADSSKGSHGRQYAPGHYHLPEHSRRLIGDAQRGRSRKPPTDEQRIAMGVLRRRIAKRGPDHPNWKGGGSVEKDRAFRRCAEYKAWRRSVFRRDDWTCRSCKRRGGKLHPHHIEPVSVCPDKRFSVSNGMTLCEECHRKLHRVFKPWTDRAVPRMTELLTCSPERLLPAPGGGR